MWVCGNWSMWRWLCIYTYRPLLSKNMDIRTSVIPALYQTRRRVSGSRGHAGCWGSGSGSGSEPSLYNMSHLWYVDIWYKFSMNIWNQPDTAQRGPDASWHWPASIQHWPDGGPISCISVEPGTIRRRNIHHSQNVSLFPFYFRHTGSLTSSSLESCCHLGFILSVVKILPNIACWQRCLLVISVIFHYLLTAHLFSSW